MIAFLPIPGGHIKLAERFFDPALSFTMGWNYWYAEMCDPRDALCADIRLRYNWTIVLPAELSAAALLFGFWRPDVNPAAWISLTLVVTIVINMFGARMYGEMEFIFACVVFHFRVWNRCELLTAQSRS